MNMAHAALEGLRDINSHKFRSFLTMLGIILGVASLMTMFAITEGMTVAYREGLEEGGDLEKLRIVADAPPASQEIMSDISPGLNYQDAIALRKASPYIDWVSPFVAISGRVHYYNKSDRTDIKGVEQEFIQMERHTMPEGRFINDFDLQNKARVVVLGAQVVERLFGRPSPKVVGSWVKINNVQFKVIGYFPRYMTDEQLREKELGISEEQQKRREDRGGRSRGWDPFRWKNDMAVIPLTTMQAIFKSANMQNGVDAGPDMHLSEIQVGITEVEKVPIAREQITNVLLQTHRGIQDFSFIYRQDAIDDIDKRVWAMKFSGGLIASIGLLVGGVGIMNIMLASITDRIREIGIRRAVGARALDIFIQVLMEAFLLAIAGGIAGILLGKGLVFFLDVVAKIPNRPIIEPWTVLMSFAFALATGIIAGIYPAFRASALRPVEALKFE